MDKGNNINPFLWIFAIMAILATILYVRKSQSLAKIRANQEACVQNLKLISSAIEQLAVNVKRFREPLTWDAPGTAIIDFLPGKQRVYCPDGGQYEFSKYSDIPECSINEHTEAFKRTLKARIPTEF